MNSAINKALADVRRALQEWDSGGVGVTTIGSIPSMGISSGTPALGAMSVSSNPQKNEDPPEMKNVSDELDPLDKFLKTMADLVMNGYDTDPDTAITIVFAAISELVDAKLLVALPESDASPETLLMWVDQAKKADLAAKVVSIAFEQSEETDG